MRAMDSMRRVDGKQEFVGLGSMFDGCDQRLDAEVRLTHVHFFFSV